MTYRMAVTGAITGTIIALGCSAEPSAPETTPTVLAVVPASGTTNVDPTLPLTVTFSHSMASGMEVNVVLHEGTVSGVQVSGTAVWSSDRRTLTFTPSQALRSGTVYALHLAGNMRSSGGQMVNHAMCEGLGGQRVTAGMMGGGQRPGMMGPGWQGSDGAYGMVFTFTTA
ncbi:MAG TPA: Ig-like domain-containing protein [Gemmatimonadaceae bacterium]